MLEATIGLTTFKFATEFLKREDLLPGFVQGYSKINHDETRQIGYGVRFLHETVAAYPETADVVRDALGELRPAVAESLRPPGNGITGVLGVTEDDLRGFALDGMTRRLQSIDLPIETLHA